MSHSHDLPPDLLDAARALEEHRPSMTEPELARVKRRAAGSAPRGFARSRVTITAMLATGLLATSGGAALGVSALSTDLSSGSAQYGTPTTTTTTTTPPPDLTSPPPGETAPPSERGRRRHRRPAEHGRRVRRPRDARAERRPARRAAGVAADAPSAVAQAPRQLAASEADELPFTGYAAIPMLLIGMALLISGVLLRRRTTD